ncbi:MAG: response regulator [Chloroflexota bacterium]
MVFKQEKQVILWVEDDRQDRLLIEDALEEVEIKGDVQFVWDGEEALDYLLRQGEYQHLTTKEYPSLIMMDLNMPRKNGLETVQEIRNNSNIPHIPIIIFTTSSAQSDKMQSYDLKVSSFMTKPKSFEDLKNIIRYIEDSQAYMF